MQMPHSINTMSKRWWLVVGLLATCLSQPLMAYQQGSFFLFDIREDAAESGTAGRIVVAASIFKAELPNPATKPAGQSEFETRITSLGNDDSTLGPSGAKILDTEVDAPKSKSSFGDDPPAPSGFYFSY